MFSCNFSICRIGSYYVYRLENFVDFYFVMKIERKSKENTHKKLRKNKKNKIVLNFQFTY